MDKSLPTAYCFSQPRWGLPVSVKYKFILPAHCQYRMSGLFYYKKYCFLLTNTPQGYILFHIKRIPHEGIYEKGETAYV